MSRALVVLICGFLVLTVSMGLRQSLGLFQAELLITTGWTSSFFGLALAIQNLMWGLAQPFAGAIADRFGTSRTIIIGAGIYAIGLAAMALSRDPLLWQLGTGMVIGIGAASTGIPLVLGAVGRATPPERRSFALGIAAAGGSFGQFLMALVSQGLIETLGWSPALVALAAFCAFMVPLSLVLHGKAAGAAVGTVSQSLGQALAEASRTQGFWLLCAGFFVCGFHVAFIVTHLPAFATLCGLSPAVGAASVAVIGLFNVVGTISAGWLGGRYRKKWLLAAIYGLRGVVIVVFLFLPKTTTTFMLFSGSIGLLWLSTVPLTSGLVAHIFGPRYMATLFSVVFLAHQVGAFLGAWLGGVAFEMTGSYDAVWIIGAALGFMAAAAHWPMHDRPVARLAADAG